ncbi:MAG: AAA family ATPase, partial [SAR202 cluster bacterium]|nr:AAA family ATPase [SAR202 cluster bacterium]
RRWLLVDVDAACPSGVSSSAAEHQAAIERAQAVKSALMADGWAAPILMDSGNGAALLWRVDLPAKDDGLVKKCLEAVAFRFSDDGAEIDRSVFNPARIYRLPGTWNRKGDNISARPHRTARILESPDTLQVVPKVLLERLASTAPPPSKQNRSVPNPKEPLDVLAWITTHRLDVAGPFQWDNGQRWIFRVCPWNEDHRNRSAFILQFVNGAIAAGCHHNGCHGKGWHDLRNLYEPGWRDQKLLTGYKSGRNARRPLDDGQDAPAPTIPMVVCLADVQPEAVRWLWPGYVPLGKVTIIAGDPGLGKSWATLDLAARLTVGGETPDRKHFMERGAVVLLTAEDGLADTVRPRVDTQGGDALQVHVVDAMTEPDGSQRLPSLIEDMRALEQVVVSTGARLVIVDPLNAFMDGTDSHVDAQVRRALTPLAKMAERTGAAVIVVMHLNKTTLQPALYRVNGTIGYVGAARSVLLVARDKDAVGRRVLALIKANLAGEMPALGFTITHEPALAWEGTVETDIAELLAGPSGEREEESAAFAEAEAFLRDLLGGGPVDAKLGIQEAQRVGIAKRTLDRARAQLGIRAQQLRQPGKRGASGWVWKLPGSECHSSTSPTLGNLNQGGSDAPDSGCQTPVGIEPGNLNHDLNNWREL